MDFFWNIGFRTAQDLTLIIGIFGISFSFLLLISPVLVSSLSRKFNRRIDIDDTIRYIDKGIQTRDLFYTHNLIVGICLIVGSLFSLIFFLFQADASNLANVFYIPKKHYLITELIFSSVALFWTIACIVGLVLGILFVFAPNKMRMMEDKMNAWFETQSVVTKLDKVGGEVDSFFFQHHVLFGIIGMISSTFIIISSILTFM